MSDHPSARLPKWLKPSNYLIIGLQRLGLSVGTMYVLAVPGRKSGVMRATPVSPLTVEGERYIVAGVKESDWARNVRAAGWGELHRGRRTTRVGIEEVLDRDLQIEVLRAFPVEIPHGVQFFVKLGLVTGPTPDEFEAAVDKTAVFRIVPSVV